MVAMTWSEAARYYNWLSEQERIPEQEWCYLPNDDQRLDPEMRARENFIELFGYQLPTEAKREFACQAEAKTPRFYRQSDSRTVACKSTRGIRRIQTTTHGLWEV